MSVRVVRSVSYVRQSKSIFVGFIIKMSEKRRKQFSVRNSENNFCPSAFSSTMTSYFHIDFKFKKFICDSVFSWGYTNLNRPVLMKIELEKLFSGSKHLWLKIRKNYFFVIISSTISLKKFC